MAKIKKNLQTLSGKIGQLVYVDSKSYGPHVRNAVVAGSKKDELALKAQNSRTKFLNDIAGEINRVVCQYAPILKPPAFYQHLQSLLRKEPVDNRFLLLHQLAGMDINAAYPLQKTGAFTCNSSYTKSLLTIELVTTAHPVPGKLRADSYYYSVILIVWDSVTTTPHDYCQFSEWIGIQDEKPVFDFVFKRPVNSIHWLLCVQQVLGQRGERIENLKAEGMGIVVAGSFDKRDIQLLQNRIADEKRTVAKPVVKKSGDVPVRVKRRSM